MHNPGAEALGASAFSDPLPGSPLLRTSHPEGGAVLFRRALADEIATLHTLTVREIGPDTATLAVMQKVHQHNPDCLWSILREDGEGSPPRLVGYYGYLHLNAAGLAALEAGLFDAREPKLTELAPEAERPAAIYIWAMVARKLRALVSPLIPRALPKEIYGGLPILARAGTLGGLNRLNKVASSEGNDAANGIGDIFRVDIARTDIPRAELSS